MKKSLFFSYIFIFLFSVSVSAQTMEQLFISMPDSLLPLLNQEKKVELTEHLKNGQEGKVVNKLQGETVLIALTDTYFFLQSTQQTTLEAKVLPINEYYNIICLIKTCCGPACESQVSFYTPDWKPLNNTYFKGTKPEEFFNDISSEECKIKKAQIDLSTIQYKLEKDSDRLTASFTLKYYWNKEEYEKIAPCLQEYISYSWQGNGFYR
ncbi:MAG: DUF3256 family protein [Candidatus Azobacteroides sp.]|nr:DUF3256 family protein [Candidatus Azobacteroides sp.]